MSEFQPADAPRIRVALVDDQALFRAGLRLLISSQPDLECVGEAGNGAEGIRMVASARPDVVLMDIRMPVMDGIEATTRIVDSSVATGGGPRIIVLTTFDLDEYAFGALNAGASGFLLKDAPPEELIAAVHTVAAGNAIVSPRITQRMLELYRGRLPIPDVPSDARSLLSDREYDVLTAIGRGCSNSEIAAELFLSESTVKTHVGRVLAKLKLRDRVHAAIYAYRHGLV